jgi:hypothetical protein
MSELYIGFDELASACCCPRYRRSPRRPADQDHPGDVAGPVVSTLFASEPEQ